MGRARSTCGEMRVSYKILVGIPEGKRHFEDQGTDGRLTSECMLGK
jgi:hypothetical protein